MEKQDNFFRTKAENSDGPLQAIEKYKVLVKKWESHLNGLKTRHTQKNITDETYHALLIEKIEGKTRAEWLAHSKFLLQEAKKAAAELHLREKEPPTLFKLRVDSLKRTLRKKRIAAGEYLRNTITSKKDSLENSLKQGRETIAQELERAKSGIKRFVKHTIKQTAEHSKNAIRHFTRKSVPGAFSQKKLIQAGKIGAAALLLFAAFGLFSLIEKQASPTGFASMTQENSYTETVALSFSNTTGSPWSPLQAGPLTGLSVSGKYTKGSGFSLSLTSGNKSFLIFTDEKPSNEEIISFTAAPIDEEPPEPAVILETVPSGNESALGIILRGPEKTIKQTDEVFAFSAAPEPAPQLQADRLCAVWKVNNIPAACSGNSGCCSFVGIPLLDPETNPWNAPFYLTFGRFGASWENTLQSRLVYYDVNLSIPAADIRYSREVSVPANFEEATVPFSKSCLETCILPNLNDTGYTLNISITKGKLFLEQFDYRIAQEVSISSAPPQLDANISNITIYENGSQTLNLSRYFSDRDNDSPDRVGLTFTFTASDNISAAFKKNLAVLSPQPGFKGRVFAHIAASDGFYSTTSNVFAVEVIEKPFPLDEVTIHEAIKKPLIRINQPVKWVRQINSSGSVINLTIAIPSSAFNLSLRDVEKNKSISASKIIINESGTIKNLSVFNTEKRLGQIEELEGMLLAEKVLLVEKSPAAAENISSLNTELLSLKNEKNDLTGYVVSSRQNKGLLTIFYERLFGSEIKVDEITKNEIIEGETTEDGMAEDEVGGIGITENEITEHKTAKDEMGRIYITGYAIAEPEEEEENTPPSVLIEEPVKSVEAQYFTEGPSSKEELFGQGTKKIVVSSEIHYEGIIAYTKLPQERPIGDIALYWLANGTKLETSFEAFDTNNNSLIDYIEWIVPSLSNQTYELSITVINVQSYPVLGGNWTVRFNVTGTANLTISASNGTSYPEFFNDNGSTTQDILPLELRCNETILWSRDSRFAADSIRFLASNGSEFSLPESLNASFNFSGIKVINFSCASTAYHTILELTTGKHTQEFAFGSLSEYANNDAGSDCTASGYTDGTGQACNNQGSCTGTPHDCSAYNWWQQTSCEAAGCTFSWGDGSCSGTHNPCSTYTDSGMCGMHSCTWSTSSDNTCVDMDADNTMESTDDCHINSECSGHKGSSCSYWGGYSESYGVCADDGTGTAYACTSATVASGEYGTGVSGGTASNFHSGNENTSCNSGDLLEICSSTGGVDPSADGICVNVAGPSCYTAGTVYFDCLNQNCAPADASSTNPSTTPTPAGIACDSSIAGTGFAQDGISDGSTCATAAGYLCNNTGGGLTSDSCGTSCNAGAQCDATLTDGNYDITYGTCQGSNCVVAGQDATAPNFDVLSPLDSTNYFTTVISFNVSTNEKVAWCKFSLDGARNVSMQNMTNATLWNTTNRSVAPGAHSIIFSCNDTSGNVNTSQSFSFTEAYNITCTSGTDCTSYNPPLDMCLDTSGDNTVDGCNDESADCVNFKGRSCSLTTGANGVCADDGTGTAYACTSAAVASGEYGTGVSGGTASNFHSGNENASCTGGDSLEICSSTGGQDPTADGICTTGFCTTAGLVAFDCVDNVCSPSDVTATTPATTCSQGLACDSSIAATGFSQDGTCDGAGICQALGHLCNSTITPTLTLDGCGTASCSNGDPCDGVLTNGNFNTSYGTCSGTSCVAASAGDVTPPTITVVSPLFQNYSSRKVDFNVSLSEIGGNCSFSLDGSGNTTMGNLNKTYFNFTNYSLATGSHQIIFYCNDTSNNYNATLPSQGFYIAINASCTTGMGCTSYTPSLDMCVDTASDNVPESCNDEDVHCINYVGKSCDYYNAPSTTTGICAYTGATTAACTASPISGEYGFGLAGGTLVGFHDGNENSTCAASSKGIVCQSTGGYSPNGTGICDSTNSCTTGVFSMNCQGTACTTSNAATITTGCTDGWACDSSINASGFAQDGTCDSGAPGTCRTGGHLCNNSVGAIYQNGCGQPGYCDGGADVCDAALTDGNFNRSYGTCSGTSCIQAGANAKPSVTTPILNSTAPASIDIIRANTTYTDPDSNPGTVYFQWYVNNSNVYNQSFSNVDANALVNSTLDPLYHRKGNFVNVSVYANDGQDNSLTNWSNATATVGNGQPSITAPSINLTEVSEFGDLMVNVTFTDPDLDAGTLNITWFVNNLSTYTETVSGISNGTLFHFNVTGSNYSEGDLVHARLNGTDGTLSATPQNTSTAIALSAGNVTMCGRLIFPNTVYTVMNNLKSGGSCLSIQAHNVTLNCQSYMINYSFNVTGGIALNGTANRKNITVEKCLFVQDNDTVGSGVGGGEYAIYLPGVFNATIINNTIRTRSDESHGIYIDPVKNSTITLNNITTFGSTAYGIYAVAATSHNVSIVNNTIRQLGATSKGIWVDIANTYSSVNVSNNRIIEEGTGSRGIETKTKGILASWNFINITGGSSEGINDPTGGGYNLITANTIVGTNSTITGIYFGSVQNSNYSHNNISLNGTSNIGIYIQNSHHTSITDNNITLYGPGISNPPAAAIRTGTGTIQYNRISSNIIYTYGSPWAYGIVAQTQYSNITENFITTTGNISYAIGLHSTGTNASNNVISTSGPLASAFYIVAADNLIQNNTILSAWDVFLIDNAGADRLNLSFNNITSSSGYDLNITVEGVNNTLLTSQDIGKYWFTGSGGRVDIVYPGIGEIRFLESINGSGTRLSLNPSIQGTMVENLNFSDNTTIEFSINITDDATLESVNVSGNLTGNDTTGAEIQANTQIEPTGVFVNDTENIWLNKSANITLYNAGGGEWDIISADEEACNATTSPSCTIYTDLNASTLSFTTPHFKKAVPAKSGTSVSACRDLNIGYKSYYLTKSLTSGGTCITISANNVTFDCMGYTITGNKNMVLVKNRYQAVNNPIVKNCTLLQRDQNYASPAITFDFTNKGKLINSKIQLTKYGAIGVTARRSPSILIENNTINVTSSTAAGAGYGFGIEMFGSSSAKILKNRINVSAGKGGYGIFDSGGNSNVQIENNSIVVEGIISVSGISLGNPTSGFNITGNNITIRGPNVGKGIWASSIQNSNISNNWIQGEARSSYGIYLEPFPPSSRAFIPSSNNSIISNNISINYREGYGMFLKNVSGQYIFGNNITANVTNFGYGILMYQGSERNTLIQNNIRTNGTYSTGIYLYDASKNRILNNSIFTDLEKSHSISIVNDSDDNLISGNVINRAGGNIFRLFKIGTGNPERVNITSNSLGSSGTMSLFINSTGAATHITIENQTIGNYSFWGSGTLLRIVNGYGAIEYTSPAKGNGTDFSRDIVISNASASVDFTENPGLDASANITLKDIGNLGFTRPAILRDGIMCNASTAPACINFTPLTNATVKFNVSTWGNYTIGEHAGIVFSPNDWNTDNFIMSGEMDGDLADESEYNNDQYIHFSNMSWGTRVSLFTTFSNGSVDFSSMIIDLTDAKTAINLTDAKGFKRNHTLYVPNISNEGVYVCPDAKRARDVKPDCTNKISWNQQEILSGVRKSGIRASSNGTFFKIENLTGSGAGNDGTGPIFENILTNASWMVQSGNGTFNVTINDNSNVSWFLFSWNGTGAWNNDTNLSVGHLTSKSLNVTINKTTTLPLGSVIGYRWHANDSFGNWNNTDLQLFTVPGRLCNCVENTSCLITGTGCFAKSENCTGSVCNFVKMRVNGPIEAYYNTLNASKLDIVTDNEFNITEFGRINFTGQDGSESNGGIGGNVTIEANSLILNGNISVKGGGSHCQFNPTTRTAGPGGIINLTSINEIASNASLTAIGGTDHVTMPGGCYAHGSLGGKIYLKAGTSINATLLNVSGGTMIGDGASINGGSGNIINISAATFINIPTIDLRGTAGDSTGGSGGRLYVGNFSSIFKSTNIFLQGGSAGSTGTAGSGGTAVINGTGNVTVTTLNSSGETASFPGAGGSITIRTTDSVNIQRIASFGHDTSMNNGAKGANVIISAANTLNVSNIDAHGGQDTNLGDGSRSGASAGLVSLTSTAGDIFIDEIYTYGGNGSTGGNGSNVTIVGTTFNVKNPVINTYGGGGTDQTQLGGGAGGTISINASIINISSASFNVSGFPSDGNAGDIFIKAQTGSIDGNQFVAAGGGVITVNGQNSAAGGKINISLSSGNITLSLLSSVGGSTDGNAVAGPGGGINITTGNGYINITTVSSAGGSQSTASSITAGKGGNIILNASQDIIAAAVNASGGASTTGGIGGDITVNATGLIQINGLFSSGGEGSMYPRDGGSASVHSTAAINITTIDTRGGEDTNVGDNSGSGGNAGPVLLSLLSPFSGKTYFKNIYASGGNGSTGGNGSNVTIRAANLSLFEPIIFTYGGAGIDSTLNGGGFGGTIDINATSLNMTVASINASGRASRGDSGKILINAVTGLIMNSSIFAQGGNFVSTMATGTGAGGSINISFTAGNISLNQLSTSGGTSSGTTNTGVGGNITLSTDGYINITNITSNGGPETGLQTMTGGYGGKITINATTDVRASVINSSGGWAKNAGAGGNILINASGIIYAERVSAQGGDGSGGSAGTGGAIVLSSHANFVNVTTVAQSYGGDDTSMGPPIGNGANGANIIIEGTSIFISPSTLDAKGGDGAAFGGTGGNAGSIKQLYCTTLSNASTTYDVSGGSAWTPGTAGTSNATLGPDWCPAGANNAPSMTALAFNNTLPKTYEDIGANATYTDADSDLGTVYFQWYVNSSNRWNQTFSSVATGTILISNFSESNFTKSAQINVSVYANDGTVNSATAWSANLTVINSIPLGVNLSSPAAVASLTNRSPFMNWSNSTDFDGEPVNYNLVIKRISCSDINNDCFTSLVNLTDLTQANTTLTELLDVDSWYNWTVRANDTTDYSPFAPIQNFTITSLNAISFTIANSSFGALALGAADNTTDDSPQPITIQNDGNILVNVTVYSNQSLWVRQPLNTSYFQFAAGNTSEAGAFNWTGSLTNFTNMTNVVQQIIQKLHFNETADSAEIEMFVTAPTDEPAANKESFIFIESTWY